LLATVNLSDNSLAKGLPPNRCNTLSATLTVNEWGHLADELS